LEIAGILRQDHAEALERGFRWPEVAAELDLAFLRIEGDQQHVVHGQQRPDEQGDAEQDGARRGEEPSEPDAEGSPLGRHREAHSWMALVWSTRISTMTAGISRGRIDITAATPRAGLAASKA